MKNRESNYAEVSFEARSVNEGFARMVVMGFMMDMNPTMDELSDVKTAVSEAVTNAIIHGYEVGEKFDGVNDACDVDGACEVNEVERIFSPLVYMKCIREGQKLTVIIEDHGVGIPNIEEARQPFFTTKPEMERSGMGFAFMETFMDEIEICSSPGNGTRITMNKYINSEGNEQ